MPSVSFSGHETFPPRLGWFKKAVDGVIEDPEVFSSEDALVTFGVGKNMVRSMRHWSLAAGVLAPTGDGRSALCPSPELGELVFGLQGADPFLEDPATVWWLHWRICSSVERTTLWHFIFAHWGGEELTTERIVEPLAEWLASFGAKMPAERTLERDLQCLRAMYAPARDDASEDALASPFAALGLVSISSHHPRLVRGSHETLSPMVFACAALDFMGGSEAPVPLSALVHGVGAPGRVFRLTEHRVLDLLDAISALPDPPLRFDESQGLRQVYRIPHAPPADHLFMLSLTRHSALLYA